MENHQSQSKDPIDNSHVFVGFPVFKLLQITLPGSLGLIEIDWVVRNLAWDIHVRHSQSHQIVDVGNYRHAHEEDQALAAGLSSANQVRRAYRCHDSSSDFENAKQHWNSCLRLEVLWVVKTVLDHVQGNFKLRVKLEMHEKGTSEPHAIHVWLPNMDFSWHLDDFFEPVKDNEALDDDS